MAKPSATHTRARDKITGDPRARPADDDLPTPPEAIRALLEIEHLAHFRGILVDPFAGAGVLAAVMRDHCNQEQPPYGRVWASTLVDYGDQFELGIEHNVDFRTHFKRPRRRFAIITNPPYFLVDETKGQVINEMLDSGADYVAVLMNQSFEESEERLSRVFERRAPTRIYQFADRITMIPHRLWEGRKDREWPNGGAISFGWYVWEKPFRPPPSAKFWLRAATYKREGDLDRYQVKRPGHVVSGRLL